MRVATVQQFQADHDVNGNPQRVFLVTEISDDQGAILAITTAHDEGYGGPRAVTDPLRQRGFAIVELSPVRISVREYHYLLNLYERKAATV